MKKSLSMLLICIVLITATICVGANVLGDNSLQLCFNGEATEVTTVFKNERHYIRNYRNS